MSRSTTLRMTLVGLTLAGVPWVAQNGAKAARAAGRGEGPIVYVSSQGLYYDSIVTADPLPPEGPLQELRMGLNGLETDYGPGDTGYLGGRWKEDFDGDGNHHYFSCPLLGPGRQTP